MRCRAALERIASISALEDLERDPDLAAHIAGCGACARAEKEHRDLLGLLEDPGGLPAFGDLAPAVLERIDGPPARRWRWQWAAAAAMAVIALALGYLFGQVSDAASPPSDSMAATYQAAITGQSSGSAELAYLEAGASASTRSAP